MTAEQVPGEETLRAPVLYFRRENGKCEKFCIFAKIHLDTPKTIYYNITVRREKYAHAKAPEWPCGGVIYNIYYYR